MYPPDSGLGEVTDLADAALDRPAGSALVAGRSLSPTPLRATAHRYGALVGLSCPASVDAVAGVHEVVLSDGCRSRSVTLAVAVARAGACIARRRTAGEAPTTLDRLTGPLVDIGRRALGLATPPCHRRPLDLVDASFADRVLTHLLASDLGHRPGWSEISSLHPLAGDRPVSPTELNHRRMRLASVGWAEVRARGAGCSTIADTDLTPAIVRWLDEGSLARWLFAPYPEPAQVFADVCELLDPDTAVAFRGAHDTGGAT